MRSLHRTLLRYAVSFWSPQTRFQLALEAGGPGLQYLPGDLLKSIRLNFGLVEMLFTDLILFGWCFFATLCIDLFFSPASPEHAVLGFLCCVAAFCLCGDHRFRSLLKLGFLFLTAFNGHAWLFAAAVLLIFEHTVTSDGPGREVRP